MQKVLPETVFFSEKRILTTLTILAQADGEAGLVREMRAPALLAGLAILGPLAQRPALSRGPVLPEDTNE